MVGRKEAASILGVSVWILDRFIASGQLPTVKYPSSRHTDEQNRRVLIAVADLEAFVARSREEKRGGSKS